MRAAEKEKKHRKKTPPSAAGIWTALGTALLLSLVLVPATKGYLRDRAVSHASQQAQLVYSAGAYALSRYTKESGTYLSKNAATGILPAEASSSVYLQTGALLNLSPLLPEEFTGYFALVTNNAGTGIEYALWSEEAFSEILPKQLLNGNQVVACYPPEEKTE